MSNKTQWRACGLVALSVAATLAFAQPHEGHREEHRGPAPHARFVRPPPPHPGFRFDARYGHARYYPPRGFGVTVLPSGFVAVNHFHDRFFFAGGVFYAARGPGFVVVAPPVGLFVPVLPVDYATVTLGGVPYYYANDTYYAAAPGGYQVVAPPPGADTAPMDGGDGSADYSQGDPNQAPPQGYAPPPAAGAPQPLPPGGPFVYPMNGQSEQQQSQDKWECHQWAVQQTGFDPTAPNQPQGARGGYDRALGACLQGRGYSVK